MGIADLWTLTKWLSWYIYGHESRAQLIKAYYGWIWLLFIAVDYCRLLKLTIIVKIQFDLFEKRVSMTSLNNKQLMTWCFLWVISFFTLYRTLLYVGEDLDPIHHSITMGVRTCINLYSNNSLLIFQATRLWDSCRSTTIRLQLVTTVLYTNATTKQLYYCTLIKHELRLSVCYEARTPGDLKRITTLTFYSPRDYVVKYVSLHCFYSSWWCNKCWLCREGKFTLVRTKDQHTGAVRHRIR